MEGYSSGLRGLVANQLGQLFWCKGSNPLLSLKKKKNVKKELHKLKSYAIIY